MMIHFALIAAGVALLYAGAEGLVRGSSAVALRLKIPPLIVGLTVVAFGTSSPELVVSAGAAIRGSGGLAVGNVVGSNIANIGLILGLSALIRPIRIQAQLVRFDVPVVIAASLVVCALLLDGNLGRFAGALLLSAMAAYLVAAIRLGTKENRNRAKPSVAESVLPAARSQRPSLNVVLIIGGLAGLGLGADWLVRGAVAVAQQFGVSDAVIALTLVAAGTSLPELATSAVASMKGEADISAGNVAGSNLFNLLAVLGCTALIRPLSVPGIGVADMAVMIGFALVLLPFMRTGFTLSRTEGAILLAAYAGYLFYVIQAKA
jgi:cation:H+ antiporter